MKINLRNIRKETLEKSLKGQRIFSGQKSYPIRTFESNFIPQRAYSWIEHSYQKLDEHSGFFPLDNSNEVNNIQENLNIAREKLFRWREFYQKKLMRRPFKKPRKVFISRKDRKT